MNLPSGTELGARLRQSEKPVQIAILVLLRCEPDLETHEVISALTSVSADLIAEAVRRKKGD